MSPSEYVGNLPPVPKLLDYPATMGIALAIAFTIILLIASARFDPTHGMLTISILVILTFMGLVVFSVFFVVPNNETTSNVIGGLIAAFSTVIAYWISRKSDK
jgi:uncharacterized BrkB/YihY/UPF0761 family membrane protein